MKNKRNIKRKKKREKISKQKQYIEENKNKKEYRLLVKIEDEWINPTAHIKNRKKSNGHFRTIREVETYIKEIEDIRKNTNDMIYEAKVININTKEEIAHINPREDKTIMSVQDAKTVIKS